MTFRDCFTLGEGRQGNDVTEFLLEEQSILGAFQLETSSCGKKERGRLKKQQHENRERSRTKVPSS